MPNQKRDAAKRAMAALRKQWAVFQYKPSKTQALFHASNAYFKLLTAGGRGGKTTAALVEIVKLALGVHETKKWYGPVNIIVCCLSRQQAAMTVQRKLFDQSELPGDAGMLPMIPDSEVREYGEVKHGFRFYYNVTLKNGSMIHFTWSDDPKTWKRIQGVKADLVYIDENAGNEELVIELWKRLLDVQSDPSRAPWGGSFIWGATGTIVNPTFETFREACLSDPPQKDHAGFIIPAGETGAISKEAHARLASVLTEDQRRIHIDGTATSSDLVRIYGKQWDDKRHMLAEDYVVQPEDNLILGYDPGVVHPTGMVMCAISPRWPKRYIVVKCWLHAGQAIEYDIDCLDAWLLGRRMRAVIYDYAANERHKHAEPLIVRIRQLLQQRDLIPHGNFIVEGDKRHYIGIQTVRSYLDPDPMNKGADALLVVNPSFESGGRMLRAQMMTYRGKESTKFTGPGGVVKKEDDIVDPLRYLCRKHFQHEAQYACGKQTKATERPMVVRPESVVVVNDRPMTNFERQMAMSKARTHKMVMESIARRPWLATR